MSWIKIYFQGFPGSSAGKESACSARDLGLIPELGRFPGEAKGYPLQYSGLENSGHESDITERLSLSWLFSLGNELISWIFN